MAGDNLYLVHWKPESGLPVVQAQFSTPADAVAHMQRLVADRTGQGGWGVVTAARPWGVEQRDVLLRSTDGVVESYFISEHPAQAVPVTSSSDPQWEHRYRARQA